MEETGQLEQILNGLKDSGLSALRRLESKTNLVFLCDNGTGERRIAKIYQNKYFPEQAEYEAHIYSYLKTNGFINAPKLYETISLGSVGKCNIFEFVPEANLALEKHPIVEILPDLVALLETLHGFSIPWKIIEKHPQEKDKNPLCFLMQNTISKLQNRYGQSNLYSYLQGFSLQEQCNRVFSHRDPNYKHLINHQNSLYLFDFEDSGAFPKSVDYASLLKDMIEYGEEMETIYSYLRLARITLDDLWPYLVRTYLLDFAYLSNPTFTDFNEFQKIILSNSPEQSLDMLVGKK